MVPREPWPAAEADHLDAAERDLKASCCGVATWRRRTLMAPLRRVLIRALMRPLAPTGTLWRDTTLPLRSTSTSTVWPATSGLTVPPTRNAAPRAT